MENVLDILFSASSQAVTEIEPEVTEYRDDKARIVAIIGFPDKSRIEIRLRMDMSGGAPIWNYYSFHYMNSESECIFRYDNARHYHELPYYPHHKHEGPDERVVACHQPSVRAIRDEIEAYLKSMG